MSAKQKYMFNGGQAALISVILFIFITTILLGGFAIVGARQLRTASELMYSKKSFAVAESGTEDVSYRIVNGLTSVSSSADVTVPGSGNLNGGSTTVHVSYDSGTGIYSTISGANVSSRDRKVKANFISVPLGVQKAVQAGFLGMDFGNASSIIKNANESPTNHGNVYSNGIADGSASTGDSVTGTVTVARPIAVDNNFAQINTDVSAPTPQTLRQSPSQMDGAQSFIAPITANIVELDLYLKRSLASSASFSDIAVTVYPNDPSGNKPPVLNNPVVIGTINATDPQISNNFNWVKLKFTGTQIKRPVIENEKYWVVLDLSGIDYTKYYTLGTSANDGAYTYGTNPFYINNCYGTALCDLSTGATTQFSTPDGGGGYGQGTYMYSNNAGAASPLWTATNKDIAFKVFFGDDDTTNGNYTTRAAGINAGVDIKADTVDGFSSPTTAGGKIYFENVTGSVTANGDVCGTPPETNCVPNTKALDPLPFASVLGSDVSVPWQQNIATLESPTPALPPVGTQNITVNDTNYYSRKVNGDFTLNSASITLIGSPPVIWITGNGNFSGSADNCKIITNTDAYLIFEGKVTVSNGCTFKNNGAFVYIISLNKDLLNAPVSTINITNSVTGGAFFAFRGQIRLANSANVTSLTAPNITINNNSTVSYENGLKTQGGGVPAFKEFHESQ